MNGETIVAAWQGMLAREWARLVLWLPVAFGAGIAWFFALPSPTSPGAWMAAAISAFLAAFLARHVVEETRLRPFALALMALGLAMGMTALGGATAAWRLPRLSTPMLRQTLEQEKVSGLVEEIAIAPDAVKITLSQLRIDALDQAALPSRIRITSRRYSTEADPGKKRPVAFAIGDRVLLRATLYPAPPPSSPGQFDTARHFFFQGIGGVGFSNDRITILKRATERQGWRGWMAGLRLAVGERIRQGIGGAEGAIATALVSGQQEAIPESAKEAMRVAGLSHVLSISGLHLSLAAGIVFVVARLLLLLALPARWRDGGAKKLAALLALLGSLAYLLLSGAPVAAQRSYVMVALVMLAVLLDRQALSIRSVMLAAFLLLMWQPEMLLSISFQLSFAATLAIVAGAEATAPMIKSWQRNEAWPGWLRRAGLYLFVSLATSTVATLATAPLVMDGFGQFNSYGILANLLLGPLVSFWIMPLVVLCLLSLPFGMPQPLLWLLGKGIGGMMGLSEWVASLPGAQLSTPTLTPLGFGLVMLGGLWLLLWRGGPLRLAGAPLIALGILLAFGQPQPMMLISGDGKQAAAKTGEGWAMLTGSTRNMNARRWAERVTPQAAFAPPEPCGPSACDLHVAGAPVLVRFDPRPPRRFKPRAARPDGELSETQRQRRAAARARAQAKREEREGERREALAQAERVADQRCEDTDLSLIVDLRAALSECQTPAALHITRASLAREGAMALFREGDGWRAESVAQRQGFWPWSALGSALGARSTGNR